MPTESLQHRCELGQEQLMRMEYLQAEATLEEAEREAWSGREWEALRRLYMPLQEARRQRRQRCGEGVVCLDLLATGPDDEIDPMRIVENYPGGQLLAAGWGSIAPAVAVRRIQAERGLYGETFLGAVYPLTDGGRAVVLAPLAETELPPPDPRPARVLAGILPPGAIMMDANELPRGSLCGTSQTFARTMAMWERLHLRFLADADAAPDPLERMEGYRRTIRVDYACELAHQRLSDVAREMQRNGGGRDEAQGA